MLSRSTDGGQHWSTPVIVSHHNSAQSFNHAVEVANDGELAVLYYDDNDNTAAPGIPTDVYFRHSGDGGQTWSSPQKLATFDFANAPIARGQFVGDYQGLAAIGAHDLLAFFGVADTTTTRPTWCRSASPGDSSGAGSGISPDVVAWL